MSGSSSQSGPQLRQVDMEDEDWLPDDFQPMSLKQLVWTKMKNAPLVGVGEWESASPAESH